MHIYLLSFTSCNPSQCLTKPANNGLSLCMLSTNWASVCWGITPLAPCTNIKNYWSAKHSCASNIRNYMSYVNYAATNQIYVFSCIFIDVIIIFIISLN